MKDRVWGHLRVAQGCGGSLRVVTAPEGHTGELRRGMKVGLRKLLVQPDLLSEPLPAFISFLQPSEQLCVKTTKLGQIFPLSTSCAELPRLLGAPDPSQNERKCDVC